MAEKRRLKDAWRRKKKRKPHVGGGGRRRGFSAERLASDDFSGLLILLKIMKSTASLTILSQQYMYRQNRIIRCGGTKIGQAV